MRFDENVVVFFSILVPMPPSIVQEPDIDLIFDPRVNLELPCVAQGDPTPVYTWTKNGRLLNSTGQNNRMTQATDSGTLTFTEPESLHQGYYQCNATNTWGK